MIDEKVSSQICV